MANNVSVLAMFEILLSGNRDNVQRVYLKSQATMIRTCSEITKNLSKTILKCTVSVCGRRRQERRLSGLSDWRELGRAEIYKSPNTVQS